MFLGSAQRYLPPIRSYRNCIGLHTHCSVYSFPRMARPQPANILPTHKRTYLAKAPSHRPIENLHNDTAQHLLGGNNYKYLTGSFANPYTKNIALHVQQAASKLRRIERLSKASYKTTTSRCCIKNPRPFFPSSQYITTWQEAPTRNVLHGIAKQAPHSFTHAPFIRLQRNELAQ